MLSHGVLTLDPRLGTAPLPVVTVIEPRLKTTSLVLVVGYGARHDPPGGGGLAHMLEHMLVSAPVGGVSSFCEHVERLGGYANAETAPEYMLFTAQVHADDAEPVLALLCEAVLRPRLSDVELDRERGIVLQELAAAESDPGDVVQDAFIAELLPGHPLGRPIGGTVAEIDALTLAAVSEQHRTTFLGAARALVVIGPRPPAGMLPAGMLPTAAPAKSPPVALVPSESLVPSAIQPSWPDEFCWVCAGSQAAAFGAPEGYAFTVLQHLLGGSPSSLSYRRLRGEKGLAYAFQAWYRGYTETGTWRVLIGLEPANGPAAVEVVREILADVAAQGPAPDDLNAAIKQAQMRIILDEETPLEFAREIAYRTRAGTRRWSPEAAVAALGHVSAEAVAKAAARVADGLVVTVRPEGRT